MMNYIKNIIKSYNGLPKEIYILFLANIINAAGSFVIPLLTLILTQKIGLSPYLAGIYISIFGCMYLPSGIIGGKLTDMFGRKKIIIIFQLLACLMYILCGILKPSLFTVGLIMLAGLFSGFVYPALSSMTADLTTPENRNISYSFTYMGWNLGFAIGPFIGGLLFENHLGILFIGDASTTLIALLLIIIFIKETFNKELHIITNTEEYSTNLENNETGSLLTVLLRRKTLLLVCLAVFGYTLGYAQWGFLLPIETAKFYGLLGAKHYGILTSFNGLIVILLTPIVTKALSQTKNLRNILIAGIFYTIGIGLFGFVTKFSLLFVCVFTFTIGEIILTTNLNTYVANHTPKSHRGRMLGIVPILTGAGYVIGPLVLGNLLRYINILYIWRGLAFIIFLSTILVIFILRIERKKES